MRKIVSFTILFMLLFAGCSKTGIEDRMGGPEITATPDIKVPKKDNNTWLIQVTDSKKAIVPFSGKPLEFTLNFYMVAWKNGGNDVNGNYEGRALVTFDFDYKKLSDKEVSYTGNVFTDNLIDMKFEISPYNSGQFDKIRKAGADELYIAPLGSFNGMSAFLGSVNAAKWEAWQAKDSKSGDILLKVDDSFSDSKKVPIGINLLISGERITVDIPTYNSTWKLSYFNGSIGKNKDGKDPLDIFRDILITRMEQRQETVNNQNVNTNPAAGGEKNNSTGTNGGYLKDSEGHEGFDTNGDGKLDMWVDDDGNVRMDLDKDGKWDPVIKGEFSDGGLKQ